MSGLVTRRRTVWGVSVGILMLDSGFQRFPGDIGHGDTWRFPVLYHVVTGASPDRVVHAAGDAGILTAFKAGIDHLVGLGVDGITTSCGFLARLHPALRAYSPVPLATSSLLQVPMVQALLPATQSVGILTFDAAALTAEHLMAVGVDPATPVQGLAPDGAFQRAILSGDPQANPTMLRADVVNAARQLVTRHPHVGAIVSECTNLPPHARAIREVTGRPVYDILTLVEWFQAGLRPRF